MTQLPCCESTEAGLRTKPLAFLPLHTNAAYGMSSPGESCTTNPFVGKKNPYFVIFTHSASHAHQVCVDHQGGMLN